MAEPVMKSDAGNEWLLEKMEVCRAFPSWHRQGTPVIGDVIAIPGMSLRAYLAAAALSQFQLWNFSAPDKVDVQSTRANHYFEQLALNAVKLADALLKELSK